MCQAKQSHMFPNKNCSLIKHKRSDTRGRVESISHEKIEVYFKILKDLLTNSIAILFLFIWLSLTCIKLHHTLILHFHDKMDWLWRWCNFLFIYGVLLSIFIHHHFFGMSWWKQMPITSLSSFLASHNVDSSSCQN